MSSTEPKPQLLVYYRDPRRAQTVRDIVQARFPDLTIHTASTPEEAEPVLDKVEIITGWGVPPALLSKAKRLRWFHKLAAGVDDVVLSGALPPGVILTRTDGRVFARRMAEYVIAYILAFCQDVRRILAQQARREWKPFLTATAAGRTLGVAGVGDIGQEVARLASALGMRVVGWRRSQGHVEGVERMYAGRDELPAFLREADFVALVLPLTPETRGLFDAQAFAAMKPGAYLINVGRGAVVDEQALLDALRSGRLAGAALDVFAQEPLPPDHPLWSMDNVYVTPHISGPTVPEEVCRPLLENLDRYLRGEPLAKQVALDRGY
ncbi:MAG: D-2-hydroxyacid dehydrogenase [Bacillota bacterium]|nr:D-2-hydroxyacid dehydrogenase [Bacillota bacterium]REJ36126.1 MAG: D-2-hydroxyacid dehydrogenase [Bacillota bacterium]